MRAAVRALPSREREVLGGLVPLLIAHHDKVRDEEWLAEGFVSLAIAAHGFDESSAPDADVATIRSFTEQRMPEIVGLALHVFVRTAQELQRRNAPFDYEDACRIAAGFLGHDAERPDG